MRRGGGTAAETAQECSGDADTAGMTGSRGFLMLGVTIVAVAFGGWRMLLPTASDGSKEVQQAASGLIDQTTRAFFTGADATLDAQRIATGSYAGAPVQPPVTLVRADTASYCIQFERGALLQHENGPAGKPEPGACA